MHKYLYLGVGGCYYVFDKMFHAKTKRLPEAKQKKIASISKRYTLYLHDFCPKSIAVKRYLAACHMDVSHKSAYRVDSYRRELLRGGGKYATPCLRISHADRADRWLYGASAIMEHVDKV